MSSPHPISPGRYRRRILGLGAVAFLFTFAIGAVIFLPVVQNDLENRVEDELAGAGITGVDASFSGQDGTLSCDDPLDDPAATAALVEDVYGVRVVDLSASCLGAVSGSSVPPATVVNGSDPVVTDVASTAPVDTTVSSDTPPPTEPGLDGIVDIVDGDPLFGELAGLLSLAGLDDDDALGGDGPFTLLAPTDAAFDAAFDELGADAFNALTSDPDVLRVVLLHHATEGAITSAEFVSGELEMLDGTSVEVDSGASGGITFTSKGSSSGVADPETQLDIEAANGVVHAIDRLLIPVGVDLGEATGTAAMTIASLDVGRLMLSGVVQTDDQRGALVAAAHSQLDPANVVDALVVEPAAALDPSDLDRLAIVVAAMPANLVVGEAALAGERLSLTGTYSDDEAQAALAQLGAEHEVVLELTARDDADDESAAELQAELNDFVGDNPILFEQNTATLAPEASAVIEQVAARAARLDETAITIVGHTDSDGDAATNQRLSELRAESVLEALVARGLEAATLTSVGRGATEPVVDASGAEDKAASRRVEFLVGVT